jgi:ketosteroid isomerase-like protein
VRLLPTSLAAVLAAALLAGCTGQPANDAADDYQGEEKAVAQVIDDLAAAGRNRDAKEICTSILAESVVEKLRQGKSDCQDALEDQLADASDFDLDVESIQVDGDTATAKVKSPVNGEDVVQTLTFKREGRGWRLAELAVPTAGS